MKEINKIVSSLLVKMFILVVITGAGLCDITGRGLVGNVTDIARISEPIDYSLGITESIMKTVPTIKRVWGISGIDTGVKTIILRSTGIQKIKTGVPDSRGYSRWATNETYKSFGYIKDSWKNAEAAKHALNDDPDRAFVYLKDSLDYGIKAYMMILADLFYDTQYADKLGLDMYSYSGFGASMSQDGIDKLEEQAQRVKELAKMYNNKRIEEIQKGVDILSEDIGHTTQAVMKGNPAEELQSIPRVIHDIQLVMELMDVSNYYNNMFSQDGVYIKLFRIDAEIRHAIASMKSDLDSLKREFRLIKVDRPKVEINKEMASAILNLDQDPYSLLISGDLLLNKSINDYNKAIEKSKLTRRDNYMYYAIVLMRRAIAEKRRASEFYKNAEREETAVKEAINKVCNSKLKSNKELSSVYYTDGKEKCKSKNYVVKLEGAKEILWANERVNEDETLDTVLSRIKRLESLLQKAKLDGIDTQHEEYIVESIKRKINAIKDMDAATAVASLNEYSEELKQMELEIYGKLRPKLDSINEYRALLSQTGGLTNDKYSSIFSSNLSLMGLAGQLSSMEEYYRELWKRTMKNKNYTYANVTYSFCNKTMNVKIVREYSIRPNGGQSQMQNTSYTSRLELTKCYITPITKRGGYYLLSLNLELPVGKPIKVYLGAQADYRGKLVGRDALGIYIYPVTGNLTTIIENNNKSNTTNFTNQLSEKNAQGQKRVKKEKDIEVQDLRQEYTPEKMSKAELDEYRQLLNILEKNENCTTLDLSWLDKDPSKYKMTLMESEYMSIRRRAKLLGNKLVESGEIGTQEYKRLIDSKNFCRILSYPPTSDVGDQVTGKFYNREYSWILPVIAVVVIMYISMKRPKRDDKVRIKKILKSIEDEI